MRNMEAINIMPATFLAVGVIIGWVRGRYKRNRARAELVVDWREWEVLTATMRLKHGPEPNTEKMTAGELRCALEGFADSGRISDADVFVEYSRTDGTANVCDITHASEDAGVQPNVREDG